MESGQRSCSCVQPVDNDFITDGYLSHYAQAEDSNDKERPAGPFRNNIKCPEHKHPPFTRNQAQSFCIYSSLLSLHFAKIISEALYSVTVPQLQEMIGFAFINRLKACCFVLVGGAVDFDKCISFLRLTLCEFTCVCECVKIILCICMQGFNVCECH